MNIFQRFRDICLKYPDRVCVKFKNGDTYESLTYGRLYGKVCALRQQLLGLGIKPGQRIALLLVNGPCWPAAFFASVSIQAVVIPIDVQSSPEEIRSILTHSKARLLLTEDRFNISLGSVFTWDMAVKICFADRIEQAAEGPGKQDWSRSVFSAGKLAAMFYTSGTTKEHKAVMLTHNNLLSNFSSIDKLDILKKDDTVMSLLPLHHTYPFMISCLVPFLKGGCVCYFQSMAHYELFDCIKKNKVTVFVGVPQLFSLIERSISEKMKKHGLFLKLSADALVDLCGGISALTGRNVCKNVLKGIHSALGKDLRLMTSGGAKLNPGVARNFSRWGFDIIEGYGLTETSPVVTFSPLRSRRFDSVGKPLPGVEIKIADPGPDGIGEVAIRGENVMLGYYRARSLTRQVIRGGWFFSGDLGVIGKDGFLRLTGRMDEIIVLASGKKINPEDMEAHYLKSPYIKEICVLFDKAAGDSGHLSAVIVPDEERLKADRHVNINFKIKWELDAYSQKLPVYRRIKGFVLTGESLPRTRLGKLIRYKVKARHLLKETKKEEPAVFADGLSKFEVLALRYISRILKKDVKIDDHLELDLGLDSLGRIELLAALQDLVSVGIDDSLALELFQARTVRELVNKAKEALPESAFLGFVEREDTVFWPNVLADMPGRESQRKLKLVFSPLDKVISWIEIAVLKLIFKIFFFVKVEGRKNIPKDGSFVIAPNHVTYLDPFFVICALPFSVIQNTYFVGFGDIFRHPLISWGMRFHRLVPIDADFNLAEALKICAYILRQGKSLVYFPEGQRSIDGRIKEFRKGIGILLKESGSRVLPVYLEGAYKAWPRTRILPMPARVSVKIGASLSAKELGVPGQGDAYVIIAAGLRKKVEELA